MTSTVIGCALVEVEYVIEVEFVVEVEVEVVVEVEYVVEMEFVVGCVVAVKEVVKRGFVGLAVTLCSFSSQMQRDYIICSKSS